MPTNADFEMIIRYNNMGIIIGKLNIGIKVAFLLAFAAIAEINVKHSEKLHTPKKTVNKNRDRLLIGLPKNNI